MKIAFILGTGHCGSTLLNLLLNGHSQIIGLSEISKLNHDVYVATSGENNSLLPTVFWQDVRQCFEQRSALSFDRLCIHHPSWRTIRNWHDVDLHEWGRSYQLLMSCVSERAGAEIVVDASKAWQQLYLLHAYSEIDFQVIHLVRDGRAVVNSYLRKYENFHHGFMKWSKQSVAAFYLRRPLKAKWLQIRYEDLAGSPRMTLERVCKFLGVEFEPPMLAFRSHPYFGIGGNRMAQGGDEQIVLDEQWRTELSSKQLLKFTFLGGWLNKLYGY